MLKETKQLTLSPYAELYDTLIPEDNKLRRIRENMDFSFIYDELRDRYCSNNGRVAADPVLMFKLLMLKGFSELSDKDVVTTAKYNLEWKYFLCLNPEDTLPDHSLLSKFRKLRLRGEVMMTTLLRQTLNLAVDKGLIERNPLDGAVHMNIVIDSTHTASSSGCYHPVAALKRYSGKLRALLKTIDPSATAEIGSDRDFGRAELEREIEYCEALLAIVREAYPEMLSSRKISEAYNRLEEVLNDVIEHYAVSPSDPDARLGHKSADTEFFGYKTQVVIEEELGLVIGAKCTSGEVNDAIPGKALLNDVLDNEEVKVGEILGDTAYSGQHILSLAQEKGATLIAPAHPGLGTGIDGREGFTFNKDSDMFCCPQGHMSINKIIKEYPNGRQAMIYYFSSNHCSVCPRREQCLKGRAKRRTFSATLLSKEQRDLLQRQKTEHFNKRRRGRYKIEQKNAHFKKSFGMRTAKCKGLAMMTLQAAIAFFTHNLCLIVSKI